MGIVGEILGTLIFLGLFIGVLVLLACGPLLDRLGKAVRDWRQRDERRLRAERIQSELLERAYREARHELEQEFPSHEETLPPFQGSTYQGWQPRVDEQQISQKEKDG